MEDLDVADAAEIAKFASIILNPESEGEGLNEAVVGIRKLLSKERNPPIDPVIASGVVPKLVEFLRLDDKPTLQYEAGWALTNVASGSSAHVRILLDLNIIPEFIRLLDATGEDIVEQVVWGLGNLAGDCAEVRDLVLNGGVFSKLPLVVERFTKLSLQRNTCWLVSNLNRGKPQPALHVVLPSIPLIQKWLRIADDECIQDALWSLSYLSDGPDERIRAVLASDMAEQVVGFLRHTSPGIVTPALRTVGNIVTGDDVCTQQVLNYGLMLGLVPLIAHPKQSIRKEACWTVSNITAGTPQQIQAVLDSGIMTPIIERKSDSFDVLKEATWAISNATSGGTPDQMEFLVDSGCIPTLLTALFCADQRVVTVAAEALQNLARCNEITSKVGEIISAEDGAQEGIQSIIERGDGEDELAEKLSSVLEICDSETMSVLVKPAHDLGQIIKDEDEEEEGEGEGENKGEGEGEGEGGGFEDDEDDGDEGEEEDEGEE